MKLSMPNKYTEKALEESRRFGVKPVPPLRPLGWLMRGWGDLRHSGSASWLHGVVLTTLGALLLVWAHERFWLLVGAFTAFLLVAPILATGLYALSRDLERGRAVGWASVRAAWRPRDGRLIVFGVLLAFAGLGWMLCSVGLTLGFAGAPIDTPTDFVRHVILNDKSPVFELWLGLGALLAAPVFTSTFVAVPLLLDRQIGVLGAVFTSWRVVMEYPAPVAFWAFLILMLTVLGLLLGGIGLVVILPWLGHASWHAYRDLVDTSGLSRND